MHIIHSCFMQASPETPCTHTPWSAQCCRAKIVEPLWEEEHGMPEPKVRHLALLCVHAGAMI